MFFSLKPLDIEFMKRLHDKVNVIPLIAKADTLTPEECQLFKKQVRLLLRSMLSQIYITGTTWQKNAFWFQLLQHYYKWEHYPGFEKLNERTSFEET